MHHSQGTCDANCDVRHVRYFATMCCSAQCTRTHKAHQPLLCVHHRPALTALDCKVVHNRFNTPADRALIIRTASNGRGYAIPVQTISFSVRSLLHRSTTHHLTGSGVGADGCLPWTISNRRSRTRSSFHVQRCANLREASSPPSAVRAKLTERQPSGHGRACTHTHPSTFKSN